MSHTAALLQAANLLRSMPNEQQVSEISSLKPAPHDLEGGDPTITHQVVGEAPSNPDAVNIITSTTGKKDRVPELKPRPASVDDGLDMLQRAAGREVLPRSQPPIKQSQSLDSGISQLACPDCEKTFGQKSALDKHVQMKHTRPFHCRAPGCRRTVGFGTRNDLQRHEFTKHPNLWPSSSIQCIEPGCQSADKRWSRLDNFRAHLRRIHKLEDLSKYDIGKMVRRPIARKPSKDIKHSQDSGFLGDRLDESRLSIDGDDEKMSDAEDGAEYGDELVTSPVTSPAEVHAPIQHIPEEFNEDVQERRSTAVSALTEKIMSVIRSAGEAPHKDPITNSPPVNELSLRGLSQSTSSLRYTIGKIPDESQVAIAIPKSAVDGMKTRLHDVLSEYLAVNGHLLASDKIQKCKDCDKHFSKMSDLKKHQMRHARPFHCTRCEGKFGSKGDWIRHELSQHSDGIQWRCARCSDGPFYQREKFHAHLRTGHGLGQPDIKEISLKSEQPRESRPFWCGFCKTMINPGLGDSPALRLDHIAEHYGKGADGTTWEHKSGKDTGDTDSEDDKIDEETDRRAAIKPGWNCCECGEMIQELSIATCGSCSHRKCHNCLDELRI